jgi:hypothetical protein
MPRRHSRFTGTSLFIYKGGLELETPSVSEQQHRRIDLWGKIGNNAGELFLLLYLTTLYQLYDGELLYRGISGVWEHVRICRLE